ncbi:TVP38/TMEM64 family protein [Patulibacter sp.]|uniref:TVP38/TMEM64 family protein n=1 Tax=Patulibacter sp. TaxID=1912859 RepID=UPI002718E6B3|nr:VTT domain-containing protein [Patulibacter sp.]MDO9409163.1 VTT domain-containing protein [Patulibacter sp.]
MDARRAALLRLGTLATGLLVLFVVFNVLGVVDRTRIEDWIDDAGVAAPLAYVVVAGILGAVLVPGAALAAAAGLLFGAVAGALISLPSAVLTAVLARTFSARTGGDALDAVSGERLTALTSFARRHGFAAVVVQRLMPVVPDGPLSHAFGLAGVRTRDIALATLLASGPRAFSYALLGANADDLTGPNALFAIGLNVATGALGLGLAWAVVRSERRRTAAVRDDASSAPGTPRSPVPPSADGHDPPTPSSSDPGRSRR